MPVMQPTPYHVIDLEHERANDFKQIYSNTAGLATTFYDVSIIFGEILGTVGCAPKVQDRTVVTMSWEHLKALYNAIGVTLAKYETEQKTKIRVPLPTSDIIPSPESSEPST